MIEESVFTALRGLVSDRVYPLQMPQLPTLPAIVYTRIANTPQNVIYGRPTLDQVRIQIDAYATTYKGAKDLAQSIRDAMETSATFSATLQTDDDFFQTDTDLYRVSSDYYIWERK